MNARSTALGLSLFLMMAVQGCGGPAEDPPLSPDELKAAAQAEAVRIHCGPRGVAFHGVLNTTADLITMLNGLPPPVDLPCFIAALPRPVAISATTSVISLQPAQGRRNPRILLQSGGALITSIALVGEFSTHLETSEPEPDAPGYTIKGDLAFPRDPPVQEADVYRDLVTPEGRTSCGGCHGGEHVARTVDGVDASSSRALKPSAAQTLQIAHVQALADECSPDDTTARCRMLRALFRDPQAVEPLHFAPEILTIFGGNK